MTQKYGLSKLVKIENLDKYENWYVASYYGQKINAKVWDINEGAHLTPSLIEKIKEKAKIDPDYQYIYVKEDKDVKVAEMKEMLPLSERHLVFDAVDRDIKSIQKQFAELVKDKDQILELTEEEVREKIKKIKVNVDPAFKQSLENIIETFWDDDNKATLFACLEGHDKKSSDHSLRVFMTGTKLLAKYYARYHGTSPGIKKLITNYSLGLLYHDIGKIFIPEEILNKSQRFTDEELTEIAKKVKEKKLDKLFDIIKAVNDPSDKHSSKQEQQYLKIINEAKLFQDILTPEQYSALKRYPGYSCLTDSEMELVQKHPIWGAEILTSSKFPKQALDITRHHHERIDKSGYPYKLHKLSFEAEIAIIVDAFDAIISGRPYRTPQPYDFAFEELEKMMVDNLISQKVYELFCETIQKYPVGSLVSIYGGEYAGCIGQVVNYSKYSPNKPEFILVRKEDGSRLDGGMYIHIKKDDYDNSFKIKGLPFTVDTFQKILGIDI